MRPDVAGSPSENLPEELDDIACVSGAIEVPLVRSARLDAKFLPQICILQEAIKRAGERVDVVGRHQFTVDTRASTSPARPTGVETTERASAMASITTTGPDSSREVQMKRSECLMYPRTVVRPTSPTNSMFSSPAARLSSSAV